MRVLHFILGKANKDRANGVNQVIAGLAKYSVRHGAEVRVIGKAESVERESERIARDGFEVEAYSRWGRPLRRALIEAIEWADVVHLHGVYAPWNLWVAGLCKQRGKPFVLTLHDGLAPERMLSRGRLKKHLFHTLLQVRHLHAAAGIHVLTEEESTDLFAHAHPARVFCVPNGIDLDDFAGEQAPHIRDSAEVTLGYLGRLSPEKNLDALCEAFVTANVDGRLRLKLAGPASDYGRSLLARYGSKGVVWVGPKYGAEKSEFIRSIDLFVHPSLCDVFSIAAMEVLALGTPLLITRTAKASYFYNSSAFFMCEPTVFGIDRGLRGALSQRTEWPAMASRGRQLIEKSLNWSVAARDLLQQYEQILSGKKE
jgi:glycosyltransferase involved in cell wall biosynthesis